MDPIPSIAATGIGLLAFWLWRGVRTLRLISTNIGGHDERIASLALDAVDRRRIADIPVQPPPGQQMMTSIFKGQIDLSSIVPVAIGLIYAGTGGWSGDRWTAALAIMGYGAAGRAGFMRGYWTDNPAFHPPRNRDG